MTIWVIRYGRSPATQLGMFVYMCHGQARRVLLGIGDLPPLIGNPYNGYINPYYWVDDHPLLYGNNGSLDPSTYKPLQKSWEMSDLVSYHLVGPMWCSSKAYFITTSNFSEWFFLLVSVVHELVSSTSIFLNLLL